MFFLKSHDNYAFCHAIDVAVVDLILAKRLGLNRNDLRKLALSCLLHDIRIPLLVEITTGGNVYANLSSDRPNRPALSTESILSTMNVLSSSYFTKGNIPFDL